MWDIGQARAADRAEGGMNCSLALILPILTLGHERQKWAEMGRNDVLRAETQAGPACALHQGKMQQLSQF